ncbi:hypothetical protein BFP97_15915 [Roseivirga sp. 4D4]|uniref:BamA/TamA family outer membrane protein n=1 Tax=Roseivirga sp. 4D4 TaxID=1889784 RepID=UPI00085324D7|nr:BamA/TamA family outer membrane protein [Roseivirga sp. 4D4]OEK02919.1 hypothetical protein BFP97_15915 [Roseivirga sp. 4D4]
MQHYKIFVLLIIINVSATPALAQNVKQLKPDSTATAAANVNFSNGAIGKFFMGKHYRKEWITPITAPVFDVNSYKGGLEILKLGGGFQTKSVRLQDSNGIQYNLRTVDKFPGDKLPSAFRGTWVDNALKDQISTAHPYGFLAVPVLADAVGVYHTKPKLVYVPKSAPLGDFAKAYGDKPFMIEIRPDEDLSGFDRFGNSENIVGTDKMYEHIIEDNDNEVDQKSFAKTRLLDVLIGDWDRHNDQWRWAEYEKEDKGSIFRAVPRDRDQVFVKMEGLIPRIVTSRFFIRRMTHFGYEIGDLKGFNWAARDLDHNFLNELTLDDWVETAQYIQDQLPDEVIEKAINQLPKEVKDISGDQIVSKLKARRNDLVKYATELYYNLSREVRIFGSDKHERFLVERLDDQRTKVTVFKTEKDGDLEQKLYERTFFSNETEEIQLYGLDGQDDFRISGQVNSGIKVRIVGGPDEDIFNDESQVKGMSKKTIIYDNTSDRDNIESSAETRIKSSQKDWINEFNRDYYDIDYLGPRVSFEFNPDDGLFLGAGIYWEDQGFRRNPGSDHLLDFNFATRTSGFNIGYEGNIYSALGHNWDIAIRADGNNDKFAFNYFGQGNSTKNVRDIDFYRVQLAQINFSTQIVKRVSRAFSLGFGPAYRSVRVNDEPNTILGEPTINPELVSTETKHMFGAKFFTDFTLKDHPVHPSKGISWRNEFAYWNEIDGNDIDFGRVSSELSLYYTPEWSFRMTIASRTGVSTNVGNYLFYQSNFLGGQENLRGFRRTRFAGKGSVYQNTEIRLSLVNIHSVILNGDFGLIGFIDHGKVWADDVSESNNWQRTYGPGAYLHFYERLVFSAHYGINETSDDNTLLVRAGFLF